MRACFLSWSSQRFVSSCFQDFFAKNNAIARGCLTNDRRIVLLEVPHSVDRTNRNCFRASLFSPWFSRCPRRVPAGSIGVILALFACVAVTTPTQAQTEEPSTALISSRAVALNPETGKVYAVETSRNLVSVFDP